MMEKIPPSHRRRTWMFLIAMSLTALLVAMAVTVVRPAQTARAHGTLEYPASRTYQCYLEGPLTPSSAACQAAIAVGGTQPVYDWYGVLNSDAAGRTVGYIPDGKLCSGNNPKYAGFDLPRDDWPATNLLSGSQITFTYAAWVPHPGNFRFYVTNSTYDPTKPLTWSEMESQPFLTVNPEPAVQNGVYTMTGTLPSGLTGRQIIYTVWTRSDSAETFYSCSDVVFSTTGVFPTPTPTPPPTCTMSVAITNTWPGGYQGSVTVNNTGSLGLIDWVVSWTVPSGVTLVSGWNATVVQDSDMIVANAPDWGTYFPAGGAVTIGFVMSGSSSPGPSGVTLNGVTCTAAST
jgi:predicted carbohydrate-binding protein with CBM5 and CBM33 domain